MLLWHLLCFIKLDLITGDWAGISVGGSFIPHVITVPAGEVRLP